MAMLREVIAYESIHCTGLRATQPYHTQFLCTQIHPSHSQGQIHLKCTKKLSKIKTRPTTAVEPLTPLWYILLNLLDPKTYSKTLATRGYGDGEGGDCAWRRIANQPYHTQFPVHTETTRPWPGQMHLKCTRKLAIINHDLVLYRILSHHCDRHILLKPIATNTYSKTLEKGEEGNCTWLKATQPYDTQFQCTQSHARHKPRLNPPQMHKEACNNRTRPSTPLS